MRCVHSTIFVVVLVGAAATAQDATPFALPTARHAVTIPDAHGHVSIRVDRNGVISLDKADLFDRLKKAGVPVQARGNAGSALEMAVEAELGDLKLDKARFIARIEVNEEAPGAHGFDNVEFWVETNPGTRPGPMMKVASGGELSRFLLALKVALADRGSAPTLVFDEIDTGAGGAVAEAIGVRLSRLAGSVQVLSVTHAPQVAARADGHLLISKEAVASGDVRTGVAAIAHGDRREEIARMLAGARITDEARAAADQLIAERVGR